MAPLESRSNDRSKPIKLKRNPLPSTSFHTLDLHEKFRYPPLDGPVYPEAHRLIRPHIESFNALFEDNLQGPSLLELAVDDIDPKVVFDANRNKLTRP
jgi:DNA-directed RNA polymerase I subunit RPA2